MQEGSKLETLIKLLTVISLAASMFAGIFNWLLKIKVPEAAISSLLILVFILYSLYAYLRLSRNAPLPFPRFLWQIIFNQIGAYPGRYLTNLRFAVIAAPDAMEFAQMLAEANEKKAVKVSISESDRYNVDAYKNDRIVIDLKNMKEEDIPKFEYIIASVQGMILIWTDEWLKYKWALNVISEWSQKYPRSPFVVILLEEGQLPPELAWANKEIVGKDEKKYLNEQTPDGILLRQAYMRFNYFNDFTSRARNAALVSWLLLLGMTTLSYLYINGLTKQINKAKDISVQALNNVAFATKAAQRTTENFIKNFEKQDIVKDDSLSKSYEELLSYEFKQFISSAEEAIGYLISRNLNLKPEVAIFVKKSENTDTCFCEAHLEQDDIDCYPAEKSIISCAMNKNLIVHWQYDEENPEIGKVTTWNLKGELVPSEEQQCYYVPDAPRKDYIPERNEILCFPVGTDINNQIHSEVGISISLENSTGNMLADPILRNQLLFSTTFISTMPWKWYAENTAHISCNNVRK